MLERIRKMYALKYLFLARATKQKLFLGVISTIVFRLSLAAEINKHFIYLGGNELIDHAFQPLLFIVESRWPRRQWNCKKLRTKTA